MKSSHLLAIAACGLAVSGCAGGMSGFSLPGSGPATTTMQFESEPAGAEARTSTGAACQTPCSLAVPAAEFTVTFSREGFVPQTVPVTIAQAGEPVDPDQSMAEARLAPNPVVVALQPVTATPPRRRAAPRRTAAPAAGAAPAAARPAAVRPAATPRPAAAAPARPAAVAPPPPPPPPPAGSSSSPWPPVSGQ